MLLTYRAVINVYRNNQPVSDADSLNMLDNLTYKKESILSYMSEEFVNHYQLSDAQGGFISLAYDDELNQLNVIVQVETSQEANEELQQAIGKVVYNQLTSGIGSTFSQEIAEISKLTMEFGGITLNVECYEV